MSEEHIGYKKLRDGYIAKLQILDDGINNEKRDGVYDVLHAKHRCSRALVLDIYKTCGGKTCDVEGCSLYKHFFVYKVGEIVEVDNYDYNLDEVCSSGIHYFLLEECAYAYSWKCPAHFNGEHKEWHDNGRLSYQVSYKDGKKSGEYKEWYPSGNLHIKGNYVDGKFNGLCEYWDEDGYPIVTCDYMNGKYIKITHYDRGDLLKEQFFKEENVAYKQIEYFKDGSYKVTECNDNGEKIESIVRL